MCTIDNLPLKMPLTAKTMPKKRTESGEFEEYLMRGLDCSKFNTYKSAISHQAHHLLEHLVSSQLWYVKFNTG